MTPEKRAIETQILHNKMVDYWYEVDMNGGGNDWVTLSTINGSGAVTVKYLSGGSAATLSVARVADVQSATAWTMVAPDNAQSLLESSELQALSTDHFGSHLGFGESFFL